MSAVPLSVGDVALAAVLLALDAVLSIALRLGVEKKLVVAGVRMTAQLALLALLLKTLFALASPLWTAVAASAMVLFAGREVVARQDRPLTGAWSYGLGTGSMLLAASLVTVFALTTAVRPDPWYAPRYALPLLGMVLGNALTGISLGLHTLTTGFLREKDAVEARIALGHTRWNSTLSVVRGSLRSALMPILNSMSVAGLVSIPGMMTGQILAGAEPVDAVKYQMLIMFLIAGGTALGSSLAVLGGVLRLTDARHRLRLDRIRPPR